MSVEITKLDTGLTVVTDTMPHLETAALGVWAMIGIAYYVVTHRKSA